jgi:MoxR-like ATPase
VSRAPLSIPSSVDALQEALAGENYIAERGLAVPIYLALRLRRPLFLEGEAGVGKTEVARSSHRR